MSEALATPESGTEKFIQAFMQNKWYLKLVDIVTTHTARTAIASKLIASQLENASTRSVTVSVQAS